MTRLCVVGAGAIGGHLAARLARGGAEVSVVARGPHLEAMRARGITVRAPGGAFTQPVRASADPDELGPQDGVLVTAKTPALPGIAPLLAPLLRPGTPVAFVVNGIPWWHESSPPHPLHDAVPMEQVLGGVVWSACTVTAPGEVTVQTEANRLILGGTRPGPRPDAAPILAALEAGGMAARAAPDIRRDIWLKLVNNLSNGPICLLTRAHMQASFAEPALRDAALRAMREGLAIAAAEGHDVSEGAEERVMRGVGLPHKPSILQDLEAGRPTEFDTLLEAPLRIARARGVPVPVLELLVALARVAVSQPGQGGR
ncbi:ketopantoate reductase family protein [Roseococcus sp. DSY-14]|uniref:ketopantoate reductase family protein n=1 Tax=Roseococcus sp. DSY-14 TaxID=3369650 RepID=UPI00387B0E40